MKAVFEKVPIKFGNSFSLRRYADPLRDKAPFWHYHPELEIVYVNGGSGKRHIGNHLSYFKDGDLVLIGSNLPHSGFTNRLTGNKSEVVVQMYSDFLGDSFLDKPELAAINHLFERSKLGLSFFGKTKEKVGERLDQLHQMKGFDRLIEFLSILQTLAVSEEYEILNADGFAFELQAQDNDRMSSVYEYIRNNFQQPISLDAISSEANMTVPAFCRYFKKQTSKTFTKFVNEYRVVHACKLLSEDNRSIADVSFESGFKNISNFNKAFKEITGKNPSAFRKDIKKIVK